MMNDVIEIIFWLVMVVAAWAVVNDIACKKPDRIEDWDRKKAKYGITYQSIKK